MKLKFLAAAAAIATLMAGPATAREVYHRGHHYHHYRVGPVGAAAGIAGAAIGTAGAIAAAPFRGALRLRPGLRPGLWSGPILQARMVGDKGGLCGRLFQSRRRQWDVDFCSG